jgi:hypothetical protein
MKRAVCLCLLLVAGCGRPATNAQSQEEGKYKIVCLDPTSTHTVARWINADFYTSYGWLVIHDINGRVYYRSSGTCEVSRLR